MLKTPILILLAALSAPLLSALHAQDSEAAKKRHLAHDVQALLRKSYSLHHHDLEGKLSSGARSVPFRLGLQENMVRFRFSDPIQIIHLDLTGNGTELREVVKGSNAPVPAQRYAEKVRGTEINYEDLAMRFLYWPFPEIVGEESVKTRDTWRLRVYNPDDTGKTGPYVAVEIWVDKESGGMLKLRAFDYSGKMVKQFNVVSGQKVDGAWILRRMSVESFKPGEDRPFARTYLDIDRPED